MKKKRIIVLAIISLLAGILIFLGISFYNYYKTPEKTLGVGANIEKALLSADGKISYVKLLGGSLDKNITKIKFIFTDIEGKEYVYETSEGVKEIEVPFKRSFWDWLFRRQFTGVYDYQINSSEIGLDNFENIDEVSVLFEYETETGITIETPVLDTEKTTTKTTTGGGGGGTTPTPICTPNCTGKICGDDGCGGSCGDGDCGEGFRCNNKSGLCELRVWLFSDTHFGGGGNIELFEKTLEAMEGSYDLGMILGDFIDDSCLINETMEFDNILTSKNLKDKFLMVTGNHEVEGGSPLVSDYYIANISFAHAYHFTKQVGNILFIMIAENYTETIPFSTYRWFDRVVSENQDKIIIVGTHREPSFIGSFYPLPLSDYFYETLNNYKVDFWFYGHTHVISKDIFIFDNEKKTFFGTNAYAIWFDGSQCTANSSIITIPLMVFINDSKKIILKKIMMAKNYNNYTILSESVVGEYSLDASIDDLCVNYTCHPSKCLDDYDCRVEKTAKTCNITTGKCECINDCYYNLPQPGRWWEEACVECINNSYCNPLNPICDMFNKKCVECIENTDCNAPLKVCLNKKCVDVECINNSDCNPLKPICTDKNVCVQCLSKDNCNNNEYCWFNNTCKSTLCTNDSECEDFDDCSEDKCENGYCNFTRFTNDDECYYCASLNWSNMNGGMNITGGADINHNGSVGNEDWIILYNWWQNGTCNESNLFCDYADIDRKNEGKSIKYGVSTGDLVIFTINFDKTCNLEPWRACELNLPSEEICDGFDNNCNGETDEGDVCDGLNVLGFLGVIINFFKKLFMG